LNGRVKPRRPFRGMTWWRGSGCARIGFQCFWAVKTPVGISPMILDQLHPSPSEGQAMGIRLKALGYFALRQNLGPTGVHFIA